MISAMTLIPRKDNTEVNMKAVKEFTPEEVRDLILLCLRTGWTTLGYAEKMQADLNAAVTKQKAEREAKEKADMDSVVTCG